MNHARIFNRHVDFAQTCLSLSHKGKPFHPTLHQYFKENKQFGSRDRRTIRALCYNWFRIGFSFSRLSKRDQIVLGYLTIESVNQDWMLTVFEKFLLPPAWIEWDLKLRLDFISDPLEWEMTSSFPVLSAISNSVSADKFLEHQLKQPLVWFRCKNANERPEVLTMLQDAKDEEFGAVGVVNGHQLESSGVAKRVEIQDYSSQEVYASLDINEVQSVWDCCCASGGKSLTLLDRSKSINVYGSDSRKSIMTNFLVRTGRHRHRVWSAVIDLSKSKSKMDFESKENEIQISHASFDLIIADVPCTGSGTWNRNPEMKYSFDENIEHYTLIQKEIVKNAWPFLKPGGRLLYSTCSVYEAENMDVVNALQIEDAKLTRSGYVNGYDHDSDTMFFAELKKI
jgi:16S rRNA (cytosine967-C5)-methyltransferase